MNKYSIICKLLVTWYLMLMHHPTCAQLYDGRSSSSGQDIRIINVKVSERIVSIQIDNVEEFTFSKLKEDADTLQQSMYNEFKGRIETKEELIAYILDLIQVQSELENLIKIIRDIQKPVKINLSLLDLQELTIINDNKRNMFIGDLSHIKYQLFPVRDSGVALSVHVGSILTYQIPVYVDSCNCNASSFANSVSESYMSLDSGTYTISPPQNDFTNLGTHTVIYIAQDSDGGWLARLSFTVTVINDAPTYQSTPTYITYPGVSSSYTLPGIFDPESHTVIQTVGTSPVGFINWNGANRFDIFPPTQAVIGQYDIPLSLSDGDKTSYYTLTINVVNRPPSWTAPILTMIIPLLTSEVYSVPLFTDLDPGAILSWTCTMNAPVVQMTDCTSGSNTSITVTPTITQAGTHTVDFHLSDGVNITNFTLTINAVDTPPYFVTDFQSTYTSYINSPTFYPLPAIADFQGQTFAAIASNLPSFITFLPNTLNFNPMSSSLANTLHTITVTLKDSQNNIRDYYMNVTVPNRPPYFTDGRTTFGTVTLPMNSVLNVPITTFADLDLNTPIVTFNKGTSTSFAASLVGTTYIQINPTTYPEVATHLTYVILSDSIASVNFTLTIIVTNTAPSFASPLMPFPSIQMSLNQQRFIDFTYIDHESNIISVTIYHTFSGNKLTVPTSLATLPSPGHIQFNPTAFSQLGMHNIEIILSDGQPLTTTESFTIEVVNLPPYFVKEVPYSFQTKMNNTFNYILPQTADREGNPISYYLLSEPSVDAFITLDQSQFSIKPDQWSQLGTYKMQIILTDLNANSTPFDFQMTVTNSAPRFQKESPVNQKIQLKKEGEGLRYPLPSMTDDEKNPISCVTTLQPSFVTFDDSDCSFKISPKNPSTNLGIFNVKGYITDSQLKTDYEFTIEAYNLPPHFKQLPKDLKAVINIQSTFDLPQGEDEEGLDIQYKLKSAENGGPLPSFMNYTESTNQLSVMASNNKNIGIYELMFCISDGYAKPTCASFRVTVDDPMKSKTAKLTFQNTNDTNKLTQYKGKIFISKIQRDGILVLQVFAEKGSQELASAIDNETIAFKVLNKQGDDSRAVNFSVVSYSPLKSEVKIKLSFKDPKNISNGMENDQLEGEVTEDIRISGQNYIALLKYQTSAKKEIPPQISDSFQSVASIFSDGNLQISDSLALNFLFCLLVQYIWNMFDDFSFLTINTMISMSVPGIVQLVTSVLINFIYVDILLTDLWVPQLFQDQATVGSTNSSTSGLNQYFEQNGFSTKTLVRNLGSTFVYLVIYLGLVVCYIIMVPLSMIFKFVDNLKNYLGQKLFMNGTFKLFFSQFPPILMASLINIYHLKFDSLMDKVSTTAAGLFLIILPTGIMASWFLIAKYRAQNLKEDTNFQDKMSELLSSDHQNNLIGNYWKVLVTIRWTVTLLIIVFGRDHYGLQIMSLLIVSVLFQALLISSSLMIDKVSQKMSLFNEFATSIYLYVMILLTEFMGETGIRDFIGQALLVVVGGVVAINFLRVLLGVPSTLIQYWRFVQKKCSKKQNSSTVKMRPAALGMSNNQTSADTVNDISTMHHATDLFSRDPMEREIYPIKVMRATQCLAKDFNQQEIADDLRMHYNAQMPMKIDNSNFIEAREHQLMSNKSQMATNNNFDRYQPFEFNKQQQQKGGWKNHQRIDTPQIDWKMQNAPDNF